MGTLKVTFHPPCPYCGYPTNEVHTVKVKEIVGTDLKVQCEVIGRGYTLPRINIEVSW